MEIFMKAAITGLRVPTSKGPLSVEQLATMGKQFLANIAKNLAKELKREELTGLEFLDSTATTVDANKQLQFDVVKALYIYKNNADKAHLDEKARRKDLEQLLEIKARRVADSKDKMSDDELDKQIAALNS